MRILKAIKDYFIIKKSKLFDEKYYLFSYSDVRKSDMNPLWHFVMYGYKENRNPNKNFNVKQFYEKYPFLKEKNINPLVYFITNKEIPKVCNVKNEYTFSLKKDLPLVSIIVLTRDGLSYMKVLLNAILKNTLYPNYEVIVVDNASSDDTLAFLEEMKTKLPLKIIKNKENKSFSIANNEATKIAKGELYLFLNNDTEPLKGWLCELVKEYLSNPNLGSAGSKLIYPYKEGFANSCKLQHTGIAFRYEGDFYRPYNMGVGEDIDSFSQKSNRVAVTAAAVLVPKDKFLEIDGFDEKFVYGYEDVDLGLKLFAKGYDNIYVPNSKLYHYEFGTQKTNSNSEVKQRRLNNMKIFKNKWNTFIKKHYWQEKLTQAGLFSENSLHVGIVVSNKGENIAEGDYFTALELGSEFENLGWRVSYISQKHNEWYNFDEDIDILITLLDKYDLRKIPKRNKKLFTIAWPRNWFDRWVKNPSFEMYDVVLASGKSACEYIENNSSQKAILFPIATNPQRFSNIDEDKNFECDYCFTGSYWNDKREIIDFEPSKLEYKFNIYGKNWDKIEKFRPYFKGFLSYSDIPKVYANTKIVIDDANRVTKPYGSVNSRVFDALGAGVLVITNGKKGSLEIFDGKLPYYTSKEELAELIEFYMKNPDERSKKVKELQEIVLNNHTYKHRALFIKDLLEKRFVKKSIAIKIPAPRWDVVQEWGDYHFAEALKKEFSKLGYNVLLQVLSEWDNGKDEDFDNVLVLRGLSKYTPKNHHFNIMWNISHPDKIEIEEYNMYDFVYISSFIWTKHIQNLASTKTEALLQCSDTDRFKPLDIEEDIDILFVGNSRKVYRKVIKDLLPTKYDLQIYGTNWESFVDKKYIKGLNIPNKELFKYYNRAKIILNDHWDDMREKGFISNRIFDVSACGKFLITDDIQGLNEIFEDSIVTYSTKEDLKEKIDKFINDKSLRDSFAKKAMEIVRKNHTFKNRVEVMDKMLSKEVYWWQK